MNPRHGGDGPDGSPRRRPRNTSKHVYKGVVGCCTPPEPVTAVAFTISIEQGLMPFTETVTVGAGRAVFSGREQSAFAFPTYQDAMMPVAATAPSPVRGACATRFVLTAVGCRTRRPSGRPSSVDDATNSCRRPTRGWTSENNESGPFRVPVYQDLMRTRPSVADAVRSVSFSLRGR